MEFQHIVPHDGDMEGEAEGNEDGPSNPDPPVWSEVLRILCSLNPIQLSILDCLGLFSTAKKTLINLLS